MATDPRTLKRLAERGVHYCRQGDWDTGMACLARVAEADAGGAELPSLFYSYLGFGIAYRERRVREGIELCRRACHLSFYEPENFVNLARTCLLAGNRGEAYRAIERGYALDPEEPALSKLHAKLGVRRAPVLRFLERRHPINRLLGRFRHGLTRASAAAAA
ncbi:MAG: hypothetical protein OES32_00620 [Acidobacteriota bacterium]|nr:hypothetical protein [Acidobacteriota bacterium]MDH3522062.1 hypothetical protein [Acidobacteriota bacterium]